MAKHNAGKISSETMQHYVSQLFTSSRCAMVGVGVSQDLLVPAAQSLGLASKDGPAAPKAAFFAGEIRKETSSSTAYVAVATESAG
jgi:hypothetical protein